MRCIVGTRRREISRDAWNADGIEIGRVGVVNPGCEYWVLVYWRLSTGGRKGRNRARIVDVRFVVVPGRNWLCAVFRLDCRGIGLDGSTAEG